MLLLLALSLTNAALPPQYQTQAEVERILDSPYFKKMSKGMNAPSAAMLRPSASRRFPGYTEYNSYFSPKCGDGEPCPMYAKELNVTILPYESELDGPLVFGLLYSPQGVVEAAPGRSDKPPMPIDTIARIRDVFGPGYRNPQADPPIPGGINLGGINLGASMAAPAAGFLPGGCVIPFPGNPGPISNPSDVAVKALRKQIEEIVAAMGISGALLKEIEDLLAKTSPVAGIPIVSGVIAEMLLRMELEKLMGIFGPFGPLGPVTTEPRPLDNPSAWANVDLRL